MATGPVTIAGLRQAIEGRDAATLAGFYSESATMTVIDRFNPPSKPRELIGRQEIARYLDDVCGRDMTHKVEWAVGDGEVMAFTQACAYPDGTRVFSEAMLQLKSGLIERQTTVQAWDG